jgi:hypothetical protein
MPLEDTGKKIPPADESKLEQKDASDEPDAACGHGGHYPFPEPEVKTTTVTKEDNQDA